MKWPALGGLEGSFNEHRGGSIPLPAVTAVWRAGQRGQAAAAPLAWQLLLASCHRKACHQHRSQHLCLKVTSWCCFNNIKYNCPLPPWCSYRLRQRWPCHPGTSLRVTPDSSFAANQKSSSQFSCSVQEARTVHFPALPLMHFSSVTPIFSGVKGQCWWHKYRRNKWVQGCCDT